MVSLSSVSADTSFTISTLTFPFLSRIPNTGILFFAPFSSTAFPFSSVLA
jgi:hypothetical protein